MTPAFNLYGAGEAQRALAMFGDKIKQGIADASSRAAQGVVTDAKKFIRGYPVGLSAIGAGKISSNIKVYKASIKGDGVNASVNVRGNLTSLADQGAKDIHPKGVTALLAPGRKGSAFTFRHAFFVPTKSGRPWVAERVPGKFMKPKGNSKAKREAIRKMTGLATSQMLYSDKVRPLIEAGIQTRFETRIAHHIGRLTK